jgi:signal transduction histidine kinase
VVANLLHNAVKFQRSGVRCEVRVWADRRDGVVRLWVADNGIGIAAEDQERIFRPFERLHGMEQYPGAGIGLAIVRRNIERMGGRVGVESSPGQGSRFWVELPSGEGER